MKEIFIKTASALMVMMLFFTLCGCKSSDYKNAMAAYESGDYATTVSILSQFKDYDTYKDAQLTVHKIMAQCMDEYAAKASKATDTFTSYLTSLVRSTVSGLILNGSTTADVDTNDYRWLQLQNQRDEVIKLKEHYDTIFTRDVIERLKHDAALYDTYRAFEQAHSSFLSLTTEGGCTSAVYTAMAKASADGALYSNLKSPLDTCTEKFEKVLDAAKKLKK